MSQAPEPLKLIREWLAGVKLSWIRPATASLAVAGRPLFDYDPETGAEFIVVATAHVGMVIGRRGRLGVILFNPMADLLSDRALRTVLAHEILHLTGILWEDEVELAVAVYYTLHSSAFGTCGGFAASPTRNKARRFYRAMENIRLVHERLKNVVVECLDFRECIRKYDTPHTFFYLDPPHIPSSLNGYYRVRFTERDLDDLLRILEGVKGKFLLKQSGAVDRVAEWAREHGYRTRTLTLKRSMEGVERGEGKGYWTILFAANYRI